MTRTYNIHEAKTQLSKLLKQAGNGDDVFIAKAGKTVAQIIPAADPLKKPRQLGTARGQIWMSPDFDAPDPALEDLACNGPIYPDENPAAKKRRK
jgi:prevent-host-death family protein